MYRYPGPRPFDENENHLFFGRQNDIARLYRVISLEKMLVLFGKSGMGKSSLLKAGVIPELKHNNVALYPIFVRIGSPDANLQQSIKEIFINHIYTDSNTSGLLNKLSSEIEHGDNSLWFHLKRFQKNTGKWDNEKREFKETFLIVFDQFEEIFLHSSTQIDFFLQELSEIYHGNIPERYLNALSKSRINGDLNVDKNEIDEFYAPLSVKILFSIRADQLSLLTKISTYFPTILSRTYELQTLGIEEAKSAIVKPALLQASRDANFVSNQFDFEMEAIEKIITYISDDNRKIECFNLQIICRAIEERVIQDKVNLFTEKNIGDLRYIHEDYYNLQLESLSAREKGIAQVLMEEHLLGKAGQRILRSYDDLLSEIAGLDINLLNKLIDRRLIRREIITDQKSPYYEISHDRFIPILSKAKIQRIINNAEVNNVRNLGEKILDEKDYDEAHSNSKIEEIKKIRNEITEIFERDLKLKEFETARRLNDLERREVLVKGKAATKTQMQFFWNTLRRQERKAQMRGFLIIGVIAAIFFGILGLGIYTFVSERNENRKQQEFSRRLENTNQMLRQVLDKRPYDSTGAEGLIKRYEALQKDMVEQ